MAHPTNPDPPVLLRSHLLMGVGGPRGLPHAFSTRVGGVSSGMFRSLNFGNPGELHPEARDPMVNIRANWSLLADAVGAGDRAIVEVHQVHGPAVRTVRRDGPAHETPDGRDTKADALVTDDPDRLIGVRVADCAPVLLASEDGRVVGAVHAGWRGVVGGVAPAAVRAMAELGADPADLVAAIGPCISERAFEVGPDVAAEFRAAFGAATPHVRDLPGGKALVDLKGALKEQLVGAGLRGDRVEALPQCTVLDAELFFSHRRESGRTGRMVAAIGPVA